MSLATMSYASAVAGISTVIAAYAQAIDDGRYADVVATFCPDGSIDMPSAGLVTGHAALSAVFGRGSLPGLARHLVTSIQVTRWSDQHAEAVSDLTVLGQTGTAPWFVRSVGHYADLLHHQDGRWRFHSRILRFAAPEAGQ